MTRVLIVAGTLLYREGLELILRRSRAVDPVGAVSGLTEALEAFRELDPDVVLLDASVDDAIGAVYALVAAEPAMRVVVLGIDEREADVIAFAEAGVAGYVTRSADSATLCKALETVAAGGTLCSPQIAAALLKRVASLSTHRTELRKVSRLTRREREIVELMQDGLSNKEIARRLAIEVATVKNHVHNILDKLDVHRRGEVGPMLRSSI